MATDIITDEDLAELLGNYWCAAYDQGVEQRSHDDERGTAQAAETAILAYVASLRRERDEARAALERLASPLAFISPRSTTEEERARMFYAEGFLEGVEDVEAYAVDRAIRKLGGVQR